MEHRHDLHKHNDILKVLSKLPRKIVSVHGRINIPELVLYDFCNEACFNFAKVAYFVDNPDFNCFKGVAGIAKDECAACASIADVWQEPEQFQSIMEKSAFNTKVRSIDQPSIGRKGGQNQEFIKNIARDLAFSNPDFCGWQSKHNNHGYLIFERSGDHSGTMNEHVMNGAYLLSFCPIA